MPYSFLNVLYLIILVYTFVIFMITGECLWFTLDLIKNVLHECRELFPSTGYAYTTIPTYPCGQIGFVLASKNKVSFKALGIIASSFSSTKHCLT